MTTRFEIQFPEGRAIILTPTEITDAELDKIILYLESLKKGRNE